MESLMVEQDNDNELKQNLRAQKKKRAGMLSNIAQLKFGNGLILKCAFVISIGLSLVIIWGLIKNFYSISTLKQENEKLQDQINVLGKHNLQLNTQIQKNEKARDDLKMTSSQKNNQVEQLLSEVKNLQNEKDKLEQELENKKQPVKPTPIRPPINIPLPKVPIMPIPKIPRIPRIPIPIEFPTPIPFRPNFPLYRDLPLLV